MEPSHVLPLRPVPKIQTMFSGLTPRGDRRMSANPHANGGLLMRELLLPDFRDYAVDVSSPGATTTESARVMGKYLRDVMKLNLGSSNFRLFSPDEKKQVYRADSAPHHPDLPFPPHHKHSRPGKKKDILSPSFLYGNPFFDFRRLRDVGDERMKKQCN